jgi:hypothetical protein
LKKNSIKIKPNGSENSGSETVPSWNLLDFYKASEQVELKVSLRARAQHRLTKRVTNNALGPEAFHSGQHIYVVFPSAFDLSSTPLLQL